MVLQGVIGKFGAIFILIPDSVVGGIFCVMFGMIIAFGLSTLQYVDLRSARNLYILGLSIFFPMVLCRWMQKHPGAIETGNKTVDSTIGSAGHYDFGGWSPGLLPGQCNTRHSGGTGPDRMGE